LFPGAPDVTTHGGRRGAFDVAPAQARPRAVGPTSIATCGCNGLAPLLLLRNKNANIPLFAPAQMRAGRTIEMEKRGGVMALGFCVCTSHPSQHLQCSIHPHYCAGGRVQLSRHAGMCASYPAPDSSQPLSVARGAFPWYGVLSTRTPHDSVHWN